MVKIFYQFCKIEHILMIKITNIFIILFLTLIGIFLKAKSPEQMIKESIANYPGKCPCPYSIMSNGKKCGKRSAYSKPGGYEPLCYISDIKINSDKTKDGSLKIVDGDTIYIGKNKYRLHGIDAPETQQQCKRENKKYKCGMEATRFLKSLIKDKNQVICEKKDMDRYKRIVAICYYDNKDLNKLMVKNGWAIAYRKYSKDYVDDENFAKLNKLGIWKGDFIEPELWRKQNR